MSALWQTAFASRPGKHPVVPVRILRTGDLGRTPKSVRGRLEARGFTGKPGQVEILTGASGQILALYAGTDKDWTPYSWAILSEAIARTISDTQLSRVVFQISGKLSTKDATLAALGWGLAAYRFTRYKADPRPQPRLLWPEGADKQHVESLLDGIFLTRDLINTPANDLGPEELELAARTLAARFSATLRITTGVDLARGFPLIQAVGQASPRAPRLIDLRWGKTGPRITLVGKGVCFDSGGLDIKPSDGMLLMKKDMAGAAQALGLASAIMARKLPVRLRVLIPAVENAISGTAFRPKDIFRSRKGLTVEIGNTDAEGRLILADALAHACEDDKPDLLINLASLTGAAHAAVGFDMAPFYATRTETRDALFAAATAENDPLWPMPLWQPYRKELDSPIADLHSTGTSPAGSITAALFLQQFVAEGVDWVHIDHRCWENVGRPGRTRGGTDMGLRATLAMIESRLKAKNKSVKTRKKTK